MAGNDRDLTNRTVAKNAALSFTRLKGLHRNANLLDSRKMADRAQPCIEKHTVCKLLGSMCVATLAHALCAALARSVRVSENVSLMHNWKACAPAMQGMTPTLQLCSTLARSVSTSRVQGFMAAALPHPLKYANQKRVRIGIFSHGEQRYRITKEIQKQGTSRSAKQMTPW